MRAFTYAGLCMLPLIAPVVRAGPERTYDPVAEPSAVVVSGNARFTILTPALIRLEWAADGQFEDRASLAFVHRRLPPPRFSVQRDDPWLVIDTGELTLRYKEGSGKFAPHNLWIDRAGEPVAFKWTPGQPDDGNLKGTTRTLDGVSGASSLEAGLLSRDGWALIDESKRPLFTADGWAAPRPIGERVDWYFFGYGLEFKRALQDFTRVAGEIPLPPRWSFGAWWSRYWAYSDAELRELVNDFAANDVPLDVLVVDMDWHLDGWTGYTWNPKYFPDPARFLKDMHRQGLRVTLNLHPADGVGKHEAAFADVCAALGLDPEKTERVPFDCTDAKYMDAYFRFLHHPLEQMGVDFWWMDWQQGRETKIAGLDPLFWLNHLHWRDMEQRAGGLRRRPFVFSRWGGLGNHRYPIGFSGDTFCNWPSLAFQPSFTATAGNVGFGYWSHDIGGHQPGKVDPELYTRWIQWGALSPALRTHTTNNPAAERRIWKFPTEFFEASRAAFHLRYALAPYLYTAARRCTDAALPLCRPLYYEHPEVEEAYTYQDQYYFGDDLLVAPVLSPRSPVDGCASQEVWIPPGDWVHWFTGRIYRGPAKHTLLTPLDEIPILVRAGAVIPLMPKAPRIDPLPPDPVELHIFAGDDGRLLLYDDDGMSAGYLRGEVAWTPITHQREADQHLIAIGPCDGVFDLMPRKRMWVIHLRDSTPASEVRVNGEPLPHNEDATKVGWRWDAETLGVVIRLPRLPVDQKIDVLIRPARDSLDEAALHAGLRGQRRILRDVAALLGEARPQPIADALAALAAPPTTPGAWARAVGDAWAGLVGAVHGSAAPAVAKNRALLRMLGLSVTSTVEVTGEGDDALTANCWVVSTLSLPAITEVVGRIELTSQRDHAVRGESNWRSSGYREGPLGAAAAKLGAIEPMQTAVVHGTVTLKIDDATIELPIERVFLPSINNWWVIGPFDAKDPDEAFDTAYPPEAAIDLKATYPGKDGATIAWKEAKRPFSIGVDLTDEYFVHLHDFFGKRHYNAAAYALSYLHAPRDLDVVLALGSDDGLIVWLNGVEVHRNKIGRPYSPRQDRVPARLKAGANVLLMKINQGGGDWGFGAHVETADGQPIPEVQAKLTP